MDLNSAINTAEQFRGILLPTTVGGGFKFGQSFSTLVPKFLEYARFELTLSSKTIYKYEESLGWLMRDLPSVHSPTQLEISDITLLKKKMTERGVGPSRINSVIFALRKFLSYCRDIHKLTVLGPKEVKAMKIPKREVSYLTAEEFNQFVSGMDAADCRGLRMRALVEILFASGMRISEVLSLSRESIDWANKEAHIVGKGNKERVVYFTPRSLEWLKKYLDQRQDDNPALFVTFGEATRLSPYDLSKLFRRYAQASGLKKKVTPHVLRHTMATLLLTNGCDIRNIQLMLGHEDIETTAKYYLGVDKKAIKAAYTKYSILTE